MKIKSQTLITYLIVGALLSTGIIYQVNKKQKNTEKESDSKLFTYRLVSLDNSSTLKAVITIEVPEKLSDLGIRSVAQKAIKELQIKTKKIHVFILLPGMNDGNGAWARVDYDPNETVTILGRSISDDQLTKSTLSNIDPGIGIWKDDKLQGDVIMRIRKDENLGYVLEFISTEDPSPSQFPSQLKRKTIDGKTAFIDIEPHAKEYFVIEPNGTLSVYDNHGFFGNFQKAN